MFIRLICFKINDPIRIHSCHIAKSTFRSNARQGKPENMSDVERKDDMTN